MRNPFGRTYVSRNVVEIRLARELKRRAIERYSVSECDIKSVDEWTDTVHLYNGRKVHCP